MPSRLSTASPPSLPMMPADSGETTPSSAAASSGTSNRYGPSVQEMSMSSGSRVRRGATTEMIERSMLAVGVRTPGRQTRKLRTSADLGADLEALGLDFCQQPVDLERVEQTGAEVLNRFGAARHPVAQ